MTDQDELRVHTALEGMSFPAGRYDVITYAADRGGIEPGVLQALETLPDRVFTCWEDVIVSISERV